MSPWTWAAWLPFIIVDLFGTSVVSEITPPAPGINVFDIVLLADGSTCTALGEHPQSNLEFYCTRPEIIDPPPELFWLPSVGPHYKTSIVMKLNVDPDAP